MRRLPWLILAVAWVIQAVRITHGLDFNDEMQYYGEILGLITNGRLFSNDPFIQQGVYLITQPVFWATHALFNVTGLIVIGRLIFAAFVMWVYRSVRQSLEAGGAPAVVASLAALAVTLAVPLYNLYAPSYNTVGLGLLAVCCAEMTSWRTPNRGVRVWRWASALTLLAVAYPPLFVGVSALVSVRLILDRDRRTMVRAVRALAITGLIALALAWRVVRVDDLNAALVFSGAVSNGLQGDWRLIATLFIASAWLVLGQRRDSGVTGVAWSRFALIVSAAAVLLCARGWYWFATGSYVLGALALLSAGLGITTWPDPTLRSRRAWLVAMFVVTAPIVTIASSNGFGQLHGPAMIIAPMLFAVALTPSASLEPARIWSGWACAVLVVLAFGAHTLASPYQDEPLWQQTARVDDSPAFRGLRVTPDKASAITEMRHLLSEVPPHASLMVLGAHPWIYFALNAEINTDMVFMHPFPPNEALVPLAERLRQRRPDFIVRAGAVQPAIDAAARDIIAAGGYQCDERPISAPLQHAQTRLQTIFPLSPTITVCRRPTGR